MWVSSFVNQRSSLRLQAFSSIANSFELISLYEIISNALAAG